MRIDDVFGAMYVECMNICDGIIDGLVNAYYEGYDIADSDVQTELIRQLGYNINDIPDDTLDYIAKEVERRLS